MTQAFNAFGTTIAPVLGGHLIFELFSEPDGTFSAVATRIPYLIFAAILLLVGILISRVKLPSFQMETEETVQGWGALKFSHLKFGVFTMFCYVGGEVAVGSFIISFLEETMKFNEAISKNYLSLYWGGAMIGRFLGAISLNQSISQAKKAVFMLGAAALVFLVIFSIVNLTFDQISFFLVFIVLNFAAFFVGKAAPARTLSIFAAINVILLISTMVSHGEMAMYSVLGIGIFNSIMFSNIYTLAISGLGKYTSQGSSLVVMAILGGAIVPIFQGLLADQFGVQNSFIIPVFCYLVILIFGAYCTKYLGHVENAEAKSGH